MTNVTFYGQHTSVYEYIKFQLLAYLKNANVKIELAEVNDWNEIVNQKIPSLPTIRIDNRIEMSFVSESKIDEFVNEVIMKILKKENYGDMVKILVPTDFSDTATNALVYAHNLSKPLNGVVKLVHVHRPDVIPVDNIVIVNKELQEIRKKQLDDFVDKINNSWAGLSKQILSIEGIFKVGFVGEEVKALCEESPGKHLVVAGSSGRTGNLKKIFGSVSLQLMKECNCPVLIIPERSTFNGLQRILFTLGNMEQDLSGIKKLLDLGLSFSAIIHMVHVQNSDDQYPMSKFKDAVEKLIDAERLVFEVIKENDVSNAIEDYIAKESIDLLAMTKVERSFLNNLFHKSLTREMAIQTMIPLIVLHD